MTAVKKFDFSNSFDGAERGMVAARDFTLADLEKARAEGFDEGRKAGTADERNKTERATSNALAELGQGLTALETELDSLREKIEKEALETVLQIARKLLPHYVRVHSIDEIEGTVRECLSAVYDEPRVVVRAREPVLEHIQQHLDGIISSTGFGGKVVLFADESLAEDHCRVEWADGGAERDVSRLWAEIDNSISRFLDREPGQEPAADTPTGDSSQ